MKKFFGTFLCAGALSFASIAQADEVFTQGGQQYILKSDVVGGIRKPMRDSVSQKSRYRVVYRQVTNPRTHKVTEVPAILTGDVIVEAKNKNDFALNTSLKLKKSYKENGFYVYQLPTDKPVAQVLNELAKQPAVGKARVEVIEHLRVPM